MRYLVDSNILLYWLQPAIPQRAVAMEAVRRLQRRGDALYLVPQNVAEFWNGATRPRNATPPGLGLSIAQADLETRQLTSLFPVIPDVPVIYDEWRSLIVSCTVIGVAVHDARIAAAMRMHGLTHILTFNTSHFTRYPGIIAVDPASV